ncbi:hypothetical protein Naga_100490g7 [Nannochloropsis gaditana]|uniref:Uncharacterized protein n=1 Tax=Nannochloropsis gaditana TaxID=72520 RepID=W7TGC5_9STRA|nr:hypothetical protein Naga_100490g7 [Nannochloropsis gaditana]
MLSYLIAFLLFLLGLKLWEMHQDNPSREQAKAHICHKKKKKGAKADEMPSAGAGGSNSSTRTAKITAGHYTKGGEAAICVDATQRESSLPSTTVVKLSSTAKLRKVKRKGTAESQSKEEVSESRNGKLSCENGASEATGPTMGSPTNSAKRKHGRQKHADDGEQGQESQGSSTGLWSDLIAAAAVPPKDLSTEARESTRVPADTGQSLAQKTEEEERRRRRERRKRRKKEKENVEAELDPWAAFASALLEAEIPQGAYNAGSVPGGILLRRSLEEKPRKRKGKPGRRPGTLGARAAGAGGILGSGRGEYTRA